MKYIKEDLVMNNSKATKVYKLYKRKYMVIELADDYIQSLGSITGNYNKAIGYSYSFIQSLLEKGDKPIMEPIEYSDYGTGEYIKVINPANDNHSELIYNIHIIYIDTFVKNIDDIDKYRQNHPDVLM